MAKNKRELQAELEVANKRIAELSQSNQNANSNINNNEPPFWLKTLLEAQSESQRQMQLESQRQMQQIIERFSQQQLPQSANSERSESPEQTIDVNNSNNEARRTKADAQKPSTLQVGISLAEFAKWRKSYNDYATVSLATELPLSSQLVRSKERNKKPCTKCGKKTCPPKGQIHCPAKDTECLICRKKGHFTSVCFHNKPGFNRREETKKKLTGQIKRRCNANANFANSAAPKITVNLFSLKHRNPLGSTETTPDTGAEASLVGVNIIQWLGIDLDNLMPPS